MLGLDGGHYFLTCLIPLRTGAEDGDDRGHRRAIAETLARLPTGKQTLASAETRVPSPFSRNTLNHFARFVIVDQPAYNGRVSGNTLLSIGVNPLIAQPVDRLASPFLLFAADIDAPADAPGAVRAYTDALWATMKPELTDILSHCQAFAATTADEFHAYLTRCQVETTMPFNDYWPDGFGAAAGKLNVTPIKIAAGLAAALALLWVPVVLASLLFALFGVRSDFVSTVGAATGWGLIAIVTMLAVSALLAYLLYARVLRTGAKPFAAAPGGDLPSVLKALFVQQQFTRFAIEAQGLDDATLYARFAGFIDAVAPDFSAPAQAPGDIDSPRVEW